MDKVLKRRLERINIFIKNGYTVDLVTGNVYSPSRDNPPKGLRQRGSALSTGGYVKICTRDKGKLIQLFAHHLIYFVATGKVAMQIEHINKDRADNRIDNLRDPNPNCTIKKVKTNGFTYRPHMKKYRTRICVDYKSINLGNFSSKEEAHEVYLEAKKKYHNIEESN